MTAFVTREAPQTKPDDRRLLRLVRRVVESSVITSFWFESVDGEPLWPFEAGQYLTIEVPARGVPMLRTYTISSSSANTSRYRLTVKREPAAAQHLPPGIASAWLHDDLSVGDRLMAHRPRGHFVLSPSERAVVLMSGGVGITPMVAMLAQLAAQTVRRDVFFLHACLDGSVQALSRNVHDLASAHGQTKVHVFHERPLPDARLGIDFDHEGRIDRTALKNILPFDDYDFYLCGPPGFMAALYDGLTGLNVDPARIAYEFFGPATVLKSNSARNANLPDPADETNSGALTVTFQRSGRTARWTGQHASLLALAQSIGIDQVFSCSEGVCGTCHCTLIDGDVVYSEEPIAFIEGNDILQCIARPKTNVILEL
jgi:uncharacterized protein